MEWVRRYLLHASLLQPLIMPLRYAVWRTRHGFYDGIRHVAVVMVLLATITSIAFVFGKDELMNYWSQSSSAQVSPASKPSAHAFTFPDILPDKARK